MIKFFKKQFSRSCNFIKANWQFMVFDASFDEYLTTFGKYLFMFLMSMIMSVYTIILIVFMPLILSIFKYDESLGY